MSIAGLFNQTLTRYGKSGYDQYGRRELGSSSSIKCRFEAKVNRKLLPNGDVLITDGMAYVSADAVINNDDKVTIDSVDYRVLNTYSVPGKNGQTHHKELELVKWQ